MSNNATNDVSMGSPTLEEIRDYFLNEGWNSQSAADYSSTSSDSSFDLNESFKKLLENRRQKFEARKTLIRKAISNNFNSPQAVNEPETMSKNNAKVPHDRGLSTSVWQWQDVTTFEDVEDWRQVSEDSFAAAEKFCDSPVKKGTPLIKHIDLTSIEDAEDSDEEARALRTTITVDSEETMLENTAMSRLQRELAASDLASPKAKNPQQFLGPLASLGDETQLGDIEAPSVLWENTIYGSSSPRPSPMKLVGMLRPSTIMEEDSLINNLTMEKSGNESMESFLTAAKNKTTETSDDFRTAEDQSNASDRPTISSNASDRPTISEQSLHNTLDSTGSPGVIEISSGEDQSADEFGETALKREESSSADGTMPNETQYSIAADSISSASIDMAPQLNDTFEEVEFMMEQGRKILEAAAAAKKQQVEQTKSVLEPFNKMSNTRTFYTTPVVSNTAMKVRNVNSPISYSGTKPKVASVQKTDSFKRPPLTSRIPQASRITPHNQNKFSKYDHIVSPIGMYINHTPRVTLDMKHKGGASLTAMMHNKSIRETGLFKENDPAEDLTNYKPSIPRKGVVASAARQIRDERVQTKICGGKKINQLLGPSAHSPTVIRHDGRVKIDGVRPLHDDTTDDSMLADLSVMSGDVSLQVVRNVNRY